MGAVHHDLLPTRLARSPAEIMELARIGASTHRAGRHREGSMRSTSLGLLLVVAACAGGEDGALLNVVADSGPGSATRIELLLANAKADMIHEVDNQRVRAGDFAQEGVRYYRQRAVAGEVTDIERVDGFRVRIEPNPELVAEKDLIPFLIAYDGDQIIGIGSHLDGNGQPTKIEIRDDLLRVFDITMTSLTQTTGEDGVATGQALVVDCATFRSGIAFQPGATEFRLLLPDRSQDATATDATSRVLDMDCDTVPADDGDCDDLRSDFHAGAPETCDGMDYDCDARRVELVTCGGITSACGETEGVQLCVDPTAGFTTPSVCQAAPECQCVNGTCGNRCALAFAVSANGPDVTTCDPQIQPSLVVPGCGAMCTVEVVQRADDRFRATIAFETSTSFTTKLHDVPGKIQLRVEDVGSDPLTGGPDDAVGGIFLVVIPNGTNVARSIPIGLVLANEPIQLCDSEGTLPMPCTLEP
jgi:hypothetical protein